MRRSLRRNARSAFYYLLNFLTLGLWTAALGQIFYSLIARWFPDRLASPYERAGSLREAIAWQLATVIVTFPLFAFVHVSLPQNSDRTPTAVIRSTNHRPGGATVTAASTTIDFACARHSRHRGTPT